jgi:hypothetical protein
MSRLKQETVTERETEAFESFKKGASVKDVNEALFAKYGKRMGLKRIYEIKLQAKGNNTTNTAVELEVELKAA